MTAWNLFNFPHRIRVKALGNFTQSKGFRKIDFQC